MGLSPRDLARLARIGLGEVAVHLLPSRCFACDCRLPRVQWLGACAACWASLAMGPRIRCQHCALPLPDGATESGPALGRCPGCVIRPFPFGRAAAAVSYDARARQFLLRAKDGHRPEILGALAGQLAAAVTVARLTDGLDGIVPVPSSWLAYCRRGFSPANELAHELAGATGVPLLRGVLRRRGLWGSPVKRLGARERWSGAGGSFVHRRAVAGLRILLVDDVLTTGATASACAAALRSAGAVEVRVAVWARTPSPARGFDRHGKARL